MKKNPVAIKTALNRTKINLAFALASEASMIRLPAMTLYGSCLTA